MMRLTPILRNSMAIYQFGPHVPHVADSAFIADTATVIGKVIVGAGASIWFGTTLRGDNGSIIIGDDSNIQENCVLHTDEGIPLSVGRQVTIGHQVMLHGCTIDDGSLIGIQSVILNNARIGKNCLVGAGSLVTEGKEFPDNALIMGRPAKVVRMLTDDEIDNLRASSDSYVKRGLYCKLNLKRIDLT